jgi:hypothetical protein
MGSLDPLIALAALEGELRLLQRRVAALERARTGLDVGRAVAIASARRRGQASRSLVHHLAVADAALHGPRGRAKRIAKATGLSVSQVRKLLTTLSSASDFRADDGVTAEKGEPWKTGSG